jgi:uncharacterized protein YkwD
LSWLDRLIAWAWAAPAPAPEPRPIEPFDVEDMVRRHNLARQAHGDKPLSLLRTLCTLAEQRASHAAEVRLTADHLHDGFAAVLGADETGEIAAIGQRDVATVMESWMASEGHRDNILDPAFTAMGAGRAVSADNVPYWFVVFAGWS